VSSNRGDARRYKDEAGAALASGRWRKALEAYLVLERLEPKDGVWAQRAGDMYRRLDDTEEAVAAWKRATELYSRRGFLVKAIAVCKLILEVDPREREAQAQLANLHAERGFGPGAKRPGRSQPIAVDPVVAAPELPRPAASAPVFTLEPAPEDDAIPISLADMVTLDDVRGPIRRTIPPGQTLGDVALGKIVRGATVSDQFPAAEGEPAVYEIPLDDEHEVSFEGLLDDDDVVEIEDSPAQEKARALFPRTPLFSSLDEKRLLFLIERVKLLQLAEGEILFRVGDPGDALYVVAEGEVAVTSDVEGTVEMARLGEGAFFGEIAICARRPRNATIRATRATSLLALSVETIGELVADSPDILKVLLRFMRDRLISRLVATSPIFAPFSRGERAAIASRFRVLEADPGVALLEEGKRAPGVFVILTGKVSATVGGRGIAELGDGDLFGETSLLTQEPARATLRAEAHTLLYELPRADFQELIMTHPQILEFMTAVADERRRLLEERLKAGRYAEGNVRTA
jgi:CRP-like cAMP-binding protein